MASAYLVNGHRFNSDDPRLSEALASIHGTTTRAMCMCQKDGVEMYTSKINNAYILKRMPGTGSHHAITCDSYEPPAELSGRGEVMDGAIQTDMEQGITTLRLDFSLAKSGARAAPVQTGEEHDSVRTDGKKLTLRGTLHYLYDEAQLTRWSPKMEGKRNWWIVRRELLAAASDKQAKGSQLADLLYIPESYSEQKKDEINQRRQNLFRSLIQGSGSTKKLMLLIGEYAGMEEARVGMKFKIKHLPAGTFLIDDDIKKRFSKRFANELANWEENEKMHLLVIGTFGVSTSGVGKIEELSVMMVNENWIPFENFDERMLIDELTKQERKFVKGLRYNLPSSKVLACAVLNDTPTPVACYIAPYNADDQIALQMQELIVNSEIDAWQWNTAEIIPALPERTR